VLAVVFDHQIGPNNGEGVIITGRRHTADNDFIGFRCDACKADCQCRRAGDHHFLKVHFFLLVLIFQLVANLNFYFSHQTFLRYPATSSIFWGA